MMGMDPLSRSISRTSKSGIASKKTLASPNVRTKPIVFIANFSSVVQRDKSGKKRGTRDKYASYFCPC